MFCQLSLALCGRGLWRYGQGDCDATGREVMVWRLKCSGAARCIPRFQGNVCCSHPWVGGCSWVVRGSWPPSVRSKRSLERRARAEGVLLPDGLNSRVCARACSAERRPRCSEQRTSRWCWGAASFVGCLLRHLLLLSSDAQSSCAHATVCPTARWDGGKEAEGFLLHRGHVGLAVPQPVAPA